MDPSSDYHFLNQILGRRVKITLVCGIFQGVLQHVDPSKIIVLKKVKNLETGRSVPGVKMFFGHEIVNVELLDDMEQGIGEKPPSVRDCLNTEGTRMDKVKEADQSINDSASSSLESHTITLLNDLKYSPSEEEDVMYTVVNQFQQKFGSAMLHIKKQSVLSVAAEGVNLCRHGKLCWLQVATSSRVYLFDIFLLGSRAFNNGLQMVLEDRKILKVIHDCRWLSDCLSHQYGIVLSNVFDTQVADVLQFSMETGGFLPHCISTLQESLIRHLKMSPKCVSFLDDKQKMVQENPEIWFVRPLPPSLLKVLALETTYLLPLRLLLLDEMMSDLTTLVDAYLNTYREGSGDLLGGTEPSCMELPEELRQLMDFQRLRRERAMKDYKTNAEGLLVRSQLIYPKEKTVEEEGKPKSSRGSLPFEGAMLPKALDLGYLKPQQAQEDRSLQKQETKYDSKQVRIKHQHSSSSEEPETGDSAAKAGPSCFGLKGSKDVKGNRKEQTDTPKQTQSSLSLQEKIELLLMGGKEDD
ncbi:piRNA biogenesis protein EXD1 isoform X1 [Monodelphis domestica]|uniref:piRNA biogenesis protein EXD1 isoform X1 n=2 Tax=Monodelphis domestica TaxID=13616 RepID=UPI0024E1E012|nr:piRNA biogenesis protein EXD1 isoform X1 [Monodelphis domestica]XP_056666263.1 piRNA biogenesis protein EXD1 isoform X1 [Monodelphis domestica]XP_056666264.1 piRNA biogenesis protein EXD1 isoform X1 [Monodelphis domestica]